MQAARTRRHVSNWRCIRNKNDKVAKMICHIYSIVSWSTREFSSAYCGGGGPWSRRLRRCDFINFNLIYSRRLNFTWRPFDFFFLLSLSPSLCLCLPVSRLVCACARLCECVLHWYNVRRVPVRECLFVERFISIHKLCINFVGLLNATLILLRRTHDVPYALYFSFPLHTVN